MIDDQLTFKDHVASVARSCRFALLVQDTGGQLCGAVWTESPEAEQDQRDGDRLQEEEDAFTATKDRGGVVEEVEDGNRLDWVSNTEAVCK